MRKTLLRLTLFFLIILLFSQPSNAVQLKYLYSFGSDEFNPAQLNAPYQISQTPQGDLIISDKKPSIQVFSQDGQFLTDLNSLLPETIDNRESVYVAIDQENNYYLAFEKDRQVIKYNSNKDKVTQWDDSSFSWISAIHLLDEGKILLADNETLKVLNPQGEIEKNFDQLNLWEPSSLVVNSAGLIYIANANYNNIQMINLEGTLLKTWDEPFRGEDKFPRMRRILVDQQGNLMILASYIENGSSYATFRLYNQSGTFLQQIQITDQIPETPDFYPMDFLISDDKLYLVDMLGNCIQVYQMIYDDQES